MSDEVTKETGAVSEPDQDDTPQPDAERSEAPSGTLPEPQPVDELGNPIPGQGMADPNDASDDAADPTVTPPGDDSSSNGSTETPSTSNEDVSTQAADEVTSPSEQTAGDGTSSLEAGIPAIQFDEMPPEIEQVVSLQAPEILTETVTSSPDANPWDKVPVNDHAARRAAGDPSVPQMELKPGLSVLIGDAVDELHADTIQLQVGQVVTLISSVGTIRVVAIDRVDS